MDLLKTAIYEVSKSPVLKHVFVIAYRGSLRIGLRRRSSDIKVLSIVDVVVNGVLVNGRVRSRS